MAFSSAVLLQHDRTRSIFTTPVTFMIEGTWKRTWPRDKIQDGWQYLHDLFSFKSFCICARKPEDKWVDRNFTKPKRKFFMWILFSSRECNRFSIVIVDLQDSSWMTDGHRLKWCMKLGKNFVVIYSPCFTKLGVVQLCIFVSLCKLQYSTSYERFRV